MMCFGMRSVVAILVIGSGSNVVFGTMIHVPADQGTIQAGINAATSGVDEVVVAPGT
jgi:hypothetical protein